MRRRHVLAGITGMVYAAPALAQGKKGGGNNASSDDVARDISGAYTASGRNPDGSDYSGRADIFAKNGNVHITWLIGDDAPTKGVGTISGDVVVVDWGDETPVVYVVMPDGELHGTWADGTALEKLTRQ